MRSWLATAFLFLICVFTLPCLYFLVVAGGILPISLMIGVSIRWFFSGGSDGFGLLAGLSLANVAVWSSVVFVVCRWAVRAIYARFTRTAGLVVVTLSVVVAAIGLLPIYWMGGHGTPVGRSAYTMLVELIVSRT
jgi:hypothetical protein